ncbi:hypothetical protein Bbelb_230420 [Branchiostoma belcheri]|nr:hypothetical protein Bbelb_230420 [Branchiostoma belcheri]
MSVAKEGQFTYTTMLAFFFQSNASYWTLLVLQGKATKITTAASDGPTCTATATADNIALYMYSSYSVASFYFTETVEICTTFDHQKYYTQSGSREHQTGFLL